MKNRYSEWLTNPVILEKKESSIKLSIPKAYSDSMKKEFLDSIVF
jgi:hypothetical protein